MQAQWSLVNIQQLDQLVSEVYGYVYIEVLFVNAWLQ